MWMEGRGKWLYVRQGSARVPCYKGYGSTFVVLRVPFRKNGGGLHLNQYTATLFCKLSAVRMRGLLCTAGWDQWNAMQVSATDCLRVPLMTSECL
jgi:hypothetical protein